MQIYLLRHGQTEYNAQHRYQGQQDIPLSAAGRAQLRPAGFMPDVAYVSPLIRARQTAEIFFPGCPQIIVQDLREMCFGSFEGRHYIHIEHDPDYLAWLEANKTAARPDGERIQDFCNRSCAAFAKLVEESLAQHKQQLVIVAHGGIQMAVMSRYGLPRRDYHDWCGPNAAATAWMPPTGKQTTPCSCWKPCSIPKLHKARQPYEQWFDSFIPR